MKTITERGDIKLGNRRGKSKTKYIKRVGKSVIIILFILMWNLYSPDDKSRGTKRYPLKFLTLRSDILDKYYRNRIEVTSVPFFELSRNYPHHFLELLVWILFFVLSHYFWLSTPVYSGASELDVNNNTPSSYRGPTATKMCTSKSLASSRCTLFSEKNSNYHKSL